MVLLKTVTILDEWLMKQRTTQLTWESRGVQWELFCVGACHRGWSGRVTAEMSLPWLNRLYLFKNLRVREQGRCGMGAEGMSHCADKKTDQQQANSLGVRRHRASSCWGVFTELF